MISKELKFINPRLQHLLNVLLARLNGSLGFDMDFIALISFEGPFIIAVRHVRKLHISIFNKMYFVDDNISLGIIFFRIARSNPIDLQVHVETRSFLSLHSLKENNKLSIKLPY